MANAIRVQVVGSTELAARLQALGADAQRSVVAALEAAAQTIVNAARDKAPHRTGTLRRSIRAEVTGGGDQAEARIGPDATAPHGVYIEFGTGIYAEGGNGRQTPWVVMIAPGKFITTRGMRPRPYLRPAFDENKDKATREFERLMRRTLEAR
jgi:HK97 gp10 family phage protein